MWHFCYCSCDLLLQNFSSHILGGSAVVLIWGLMTDNGCSLWVLVMEFLCCGIVDAAMWLVLICLSFHSLCCIMWNVMYNTNSFCGDTLMHRFSLKTWFLMYASFTSVESRRNFLTVKVFVTSWLSKFLNFIFSVYSALYLLRCDMILQSLFGC